MDKIRIGIVGYGNIGRGVELAEYHEDGSISINLDEETQMTFTLGETAYVKLYIEF